jgi:hypothetical protein
LTLLALGAFGAAWAGLSMNRNFLVLFISQPYISRHI